MNFLLFARIGNVPELLAQAQRLAIFLLHLKNTQGKKAGQLELFHLPFTNIDEDNRKPFKIPRNKALASFLPVLAGHSLLTDHMTANIRSLTATRVSQQYNSPAYYGSQIWKRRFWKRGCVFRALEEDCFMAVF